MNKRILYVSEEHIGGSASLSDANRGIDLLRAEGWVVVYGDRPWRFKDEEERESFEQIFNWALEVVTAEKQPYEETTWIDLARQRVQLNAQLRSFEAKLIDERPEWSGYLKWLVETPTEVILNWLKTKKEDVPRD